MYLLMRRALPAILLLALLPAPARADTLEANGLRLVKIGDFAAAVHVTAPPGDDHRVFVVQQGSGTTAAIRVVRDGATLSEPFLSLSGVAHQRAEQGLLSMAFAPDYATSGRFYVYYNDAGACTGANCDVRVDEFRRADADHADASSRRPVFSLSHRDAPNHNGGQLQFGPDGLLYAAPGDGGTGGDPECDAQRADSKLGKVLRLDPVASSSPQVVASGLRNPFRFSFDRLTGDFVVGDVGDSAKEEVDFVAAGRLAGANFGWNVFEGNNPVSTSCAMPPLASYAAPSITYDHPSPGPAAVTGGFVVRDLSVAPLLGRYVYADYFAGDIRSAVIGPGTQSGDGPTGLQADMLASFGEDSRCRIHVVSQAGPVYRLEATQPAAAPGCETSTATSVAAPQLPALARDRVSPVLSRVTVSRRRFRVSSAGTPRVARMRAPAGTVFRYTLSEEAEVSLRFYRATAGRRSAGRCVAPTRRLRRAARCTRYPLRGTLVRRRVQAGRRLIRFSGRVGSRALPIGRYRAILRARDSAGNVSPGRVVVVSIVKRWI